MYENIINRYCQQYKVPKSLVMAIIQVMSKWNRYKITIKRLAQLAIKKKIKEAKRTLPITQIELLSRAINWGLMQINGQEARDMGFDGKYLTELCEPAVNIELGCKKINNLFQKYKNHLDVIASYIQGHNKRKPNGEYYDQKKVNEVIRYIQIYEK